MLKIQLCHHRSKLHFFIYSNRKGLIEYVVMLHNILFFTVFILNKSCGDLFKKHVIVLLPQTFEWYRMYIACISLYYNLYLC